MAKHNLATSPYRAGRRLVVASLIIVLGSAMGYGVATGRIDMTDATNIKHRLVAGYEAMMQPVPPPPAAAAHMPTTEAAPPPEPPAPAVAEQLLPPPVKDPPTALAEPPVSDEEYAAVDWRTPAPVRPVAMAEPPVSDEEYAAVDWQTPTPVRPVAMAEPPVSDEEYAAVDWRTPALVRPVAMAEPSVSDEEYAAVDWGTDSAARLVPTAGNAGKPLVLSPALVRIAESPPPAPARATVATAAHPDLAAPQGRPRVVIRRGVSSIFGSDRPTPLRVAARGGAGTTLARPYDLSGWSGIQWGATEGFLRRTFGRQISGYDAGGGEFSEQFDIENVIKGVGFGRMTFNVLFQMSKDTKALRQVLVDGIGAPQHGDFEAVYAHMVQLYGNPTSYVDHVPRTDGVERPLNIYKKAFWRFPTTSISLTVMAGPTYFAERPGWLYIRYFPTRRNAG